MKFCPNCGFPLEGKTNCNCGYNVETWEVDKVINEDYKEKEKSLYENSCDNMMMGMNKLNLIDGARQMGVNPNITDKEIIEHMNRPIFNKENDNLTSNDLIEIMNNFQKKDTNQE